MNLKVLIVFSSAIGSGEGVAADTDSRDEFLSLYLTLKFHRFTISNAKLATKT